MSLNFVVFLNNVNIHYVKQFAQKTPKFRVTFYRVGPQSFKMIPGIAKGIPLLLLMVGRNPAITS